MHQRPKTWGLAALLMGAWAMGADTQEAGPDAASADNASGFVYFEQLGLAIYGSLSPTIKRFDAVQNQWVSAGKSGFVLRMPAGEQRVGIVYSSGPPIIAMPKMSKGEPEAEHVVSIALPKDRVTVVPFTITSRAGGFGWTMEIGAERAVLPYRAQDDAVAELSRALLDESVVGQLSGRAFEFVLVEAIANGDPSFIPLFESIVANSANQWRKQLARDAIKRIEKVIKKRSRS